MRMYVCIYMYSCDDSVNSSSSMTSKLRQHRSNGNANNHVKKVMHEKVKQQQVKRNIEKKMKNQNKYNTRKKKNERQKKELSQLHQGPHECFTYTHFEGNRDVQQIEHLLPFAIARSRIQYT